MMDPFDVLAQYNAEVARGLVHTEEWKQKMAELQEKWRLMQNALTNWDGNSLSGLSTGAYRMVQGDQRPWWRVW